MKKLREAKFIIARPNKLLGDGLDLHSYKIGFVYLDAHKTAPDVRAGADICRRRCSRFSIATLVREDPIQRHIAKAVGSGISLCAQRPWL